MHLRLTKMARALLYVPTPERERINPFLTIAEEGQFQVQIINKRVTALKLMPAAIALGLVLSPSSAFAGPVTFNFDAITGFNGTTSDSTLIRNYMNTVLLADGYTFTVAAFGTSSAVETGPFGGVTTGLSNNYITNAAAGNGNFFQTAFSSGGTFTSFSVNYVVLPASSTDFPDFEVTTNTSAPANVYFAQSGTVDTPLVGNTGTVTVAANTTAIAGFHDDSDHQIAIDNLTITFAATPIPEPATLSLLGLGLLGLAARLRGRK
jgi:PEP-CTERM motif-containing protein